MENLQHTQIPNDMGKDNLDPKDQYIYVIIKSFENEETKECFPSIQTIAEKAGTSAPTVIDSINRLESTGYIKREKRGRRNYYTFSKYKKFEPISPDFIKKKDLSFITKAYIVASQQYMIKDVTDYGKLSYSNTTLSEKINMPESTIRKCNKELESKDYLTIIKNESRDIETGLRTETKLFELNKLGQAVIWVLNEHNNQIQKNTNDISALQERVDKQQELIDKLTRFIQESVRETEQQKYTF